MPVEHIEMRWRCSTCKHENLGRHKECLNCGKPKGREKFYDAPENEEVALTDPELIKQATAGADWECAFCKSHQRRDSGECVQCGAPNQAEAEKASKKWDWESSKKAGKPQRKQPEWLVAAMTEPVRKVRAAKRKVKRIVKRIVEAEAAVEVPKRKLVTPMRRNIAIGMLAATLIGVLCYFLFRTRIVDASVTAVAWTYTVKVDRYQIKRENGFDRPGDAFEVKSDGMRHHHYNKVRDGTKKEPYTERYACGTKPKNCYTTPKRCSTNNNGFKTCTGGDRKCTGGGTKYCNRTKYKDVPKYKDVSVKKEHFSWKVWRWKHNRNVVAQGTTDEPYWPSEVDIALNKALGPEAKKERESGRDAQLKVTFTDTDGETHSYTPSGLGQFMALRPGVEKRLAVGVARSTEIIKDD